MCLHSANLGTRVRAIAMQRVLNLPRHLLASFVWFRVSLVANLFPYRKFAILLMSTKIFKMSTFFGKNRSFFRFFIKFAKNLGKMCQNDETLSIVK